MDGFHFEGRQQTARQLARQYPALTVGRWQSVLEAGCRTWDEARMESSRLDFAMQAARRPESRIRVARRKPE